MTQIFAHRGANREAAENTRTAFDKALQYPIDGIETDVQLSCDEIALLWHDRYLTKVGLPDKHIDDFDYEDLQAMNFAAHFSPRSPHESLMTLQDFLESYRSCCRLLIEIKNGDWESVARQQLKVRQTLMMTGTSERDAIMMSSFNLESLIYAHGLTQDIPLVYNLEPEQTIEEALLILSERPFLYGLCLPIATLNQDWVRLLRKHNKQIAVYTCNSAAEIKLALALGVDILISDYPQKALQLRKEHKNHGLCKHDP